MGLIQDTIHWYLDNGYAKRAVIMGLDHSGKTTTVKGLMNDYTYIKSVPNEISEVIAVVLSGYQLIDRFTLLDHFTYDSLTNHLNTPTGYSDAYINSYFEMIDELLDKYYESTLFVMYLHDMFMDEASAKDHFNVINNKSMILNRYLVLANHLKQKYPIIITTERSFKMLGKGANFGYEL